MKGGLLLIGVLAAWAVLPASAGTLYKCVRVDGSTSYVSKREPNARCEVFSRYTPSRSSSAVASWVPPPATGAVTTAPEAVKVASTVPAATTPAPATAASVAPAKGGGGGGSRRVVSGQVYAYYKDGVKHYTSAPPRGGGASSVRTINYSFIETCFACGNPGVNFGKLRLNPNAYQAEIAAAARDFGVEEAIIRAIMHAESSYNPRALSHAGAQGLMQLMPATARRFGVTDSFDAAQNIRGGVQYLSWLLKRYNGNLTLAAAGYNAGEGAVDRHKGVPPYRETQRYVERVAVLADRYRGLTSAQ